MNNDQRRILEVDCMELASLFHLFSKFKGAVDDYRDIRHSLREEVLGSLQDRVKAATIGCYLLFSSEPELEAQSPSSDFGGSLYTECTVMSAITNKIYGADNLLIRNARIWQHHGMLYLESRTSCNYLHHSLPLPSRAGISSCDIPPTAMVEDIPNYHRKKFTVLLDSVSNDKYDCVNVVSIGQERRGKYHEVARYCAYGEPEDWIDDVQLWDTESAINEYLQNKEGETQ